MITSIRRLIGVPVIWQNRRIGHVERVLPRMHSQTLEGLVVRRGLGNAKWCPAETILAMDQAGIVVSRKPAGAPQKEETAEPDAYLATGQWAGQVTDILLMDGKTGFAALELSPGPVYRLLGRCAYASDFRFSASSGCVVVAGLLTWAQLRRQLGEEEKG